MNIEDMKILTPFEGEVVLLLTRIARALEAIERVGQE